MSRQLSKTMEFSTCRCILVSDGLDAQPCKGDKLRQAFTSVISENRNPIDQDSKIVIDLITSNNDYYFGSIGGIKDLSELNFTRQRNTATDAPTDIQPGINIEIYTYFFLHYTTANFVTVSVPGTPGYKRHLSNLFKEQNHDVSDFRIIPMKINLREKLLRMKEIKEFSFVTDDGVLLNDEANGSRLIRQAFNNNHMSGFKVKISLSKTGITEEMISSLEQLQEQDTDFDNISLIGINNRDVVDRYNLVNSFFREPKYVNINFNDPNHVRDIEAQLLDAARR